MKKYIAILPFFLFVIIAFCIIFLPKILTSKYSLSAKVVSISAPSKRSGESTILLDGNNKSRYLYYSFLGGIKDIEVGDSVFKRTNSSILLVKSKNDGVLREARYDSYQLSK